MGGSVVGGGRGSLDVGEKGGGGWKGGGWCVVGKGEVVGCKEVCGCVDWEGVGD